MRHADELVTCPRLGPSVVAHENQPLLGLGGLEHTSPGWNCIAFFDFFADSLTAGKEDDASEMLRSRFYRKPDSDSSLAIFSSSRSRGSTCKLRSYISCTSPALDMLRRMYS